MPVGIKNSTTGNIQAAIDGVMAANHSHCFLGVNEQGLAGIVHTQGNPHTHIILRGGSISGPNHSADHIKKSINLLQSKQLPLNIMIDCSHGNSEKNHLKQAEVIQSIKDQINAGEKAISGIMIESFLQEGKQSLKNLDDLEYGKSVTDACIDWPTTEKLLREIAQCTKHPESKEQLIGAAQ